MPSRKRKSVRRKAAPARSRERTRQQILDGAGELFAGRGFNGVGVQALADHAGTTKPTLFSHFTNKEGLQAAVVDREVERWHEAVERAGETSDDPVDQARALFAELAADTRHNPLLVITLGWYELRGGDNAASQSAVAAMGAVQASLTALAEQAGVTKALNASYRMLSLLLGASLLAMRMPDPTGGKVLRNAAATAVLVLETAD